VSAIKDSPKHLLEPITIWWSGSTYRVLDGHHRLEAYEIVNKEIKKNKKKKPIAEIPVIIFEGSLKEALHKSVALNSRDKLPMTSKDKFDAAWRMVVKELWSKGEIQHATTVSRRTIANMRTQLEKLKTHFRNNWETACLAMSWNEARLVNQKDRDFSDDWKEREAEDWAKRLGKEFGRKFSQHPDIAALAIERYSQQLPDRLVEEWGAFFDDRGDPEF
jgi:hypothetical protein